MRVASFFQKLPRDRPVLGLVAGGAFFVLASILRWALGGIAEDFGPMTFLPAILLAGLFGGIGVGIAVAAVCTLVAWVMFFPPYGTFILATPHRLTMLIFVVTAGLELYVIRMLNVAINELSEARERSNILFRELQHRVANNLQFVAALLQVRKKGITDSAALQALEAAQNRLAMMSQVHRRLHDPKAIDQPVDEYLEGLCADLISASDTPDVRLTVTGEADMLSLNALMTLSLIVAELVTNSLKHAFIDRSDGSISITIQCGDGPCILTFSDDGPGLPKGFGRNLTGSLGQSILKSLASQLHGEITFNHGPGTVARLEFQLPRH